ncbi:ester cyclase [Syntrophorhabdus aromaticivorans]|jgi:predicted ester cyclase|uniref:ester cyclase n=1 Tax=Syntrophorhabdus aromaticivorans TaxID=328301 RepID=UPI0003F84631|nr:ester cyclase [Syntrophorhabdus aromaticivorans]
MAEIGANKAILEHFLKELDEGIDAVDKFFSPVCSAYLPGNTLPVNRDGFKQFVEMLYSAFPDLRHHIQEQVAERDTVAAVVTVHGTHMGEFQGISPTGKQIIVTDIIVAKIEAGNIVRIWAQFDALGLLRQLGPGQ